MIKNKSCQQFRYEPYGDGIIITKCMIPEENIAVPEKIDNKKVRAVGDGAFIYEYTDMLQEKTSIKKIHIPDTVEYISPTAFGGGKNFADYENCYDIAEFSVDCKNKCYCCENGILYSKDKTVLVRYPMGKTDKQFIVPISVTDIAPYAFMFARFEEIVFSGNTVYLGRAAFLYCTKLICAKIPNIEIIPSCCFYECHNLKYVTLGKDLKIIEESAFFNCDIESIALPEHMEIIDKYAFMYCKLKDITIPQGLTEIAEGTFIRCNIKKIVIPKGIKKICKYAFGKCTELKEAILPEGLLSIEEGAFIGCKPFYDLFVPKSVKRIERYAFADTCFRDAIVYDETDVDELAFCIGSSNKFDDKEIYVSEDVKYISPYAFSLYYYDIEKFIVNPKNKYYYSLNGVIYSRMISPASVSLVSLVKYPINKKDTRFIVPKNVYSIEQNAFWCSRNIKSIVICKALEHISENAFRECCSLEEIKLPKGFLFHKNICLCDD